MWVMCCRAVLADQCAGGPEGALGQGTGPHDLEGLSELPPMGLTLGPGFRQVQGYSGRGAGKPSTPPNCEAWV